MLLVQSIKYMISATNTCIFLYYQTIKKRKEISTELNHSRITVTNQWFSTQLFKKRLLPHTKRYESSTFCNINRSCNSTTILKYNSTLLEDQISSPSLSVLITLKLMRIMQQQNFFVPILMYVVSFARPQAVDRVEPSPCYIKQMKEMTIFVFILCKVLCFFQKFC